MSVENITDFDLDHTFSCGQCFRWIKQYDGSYTGVVDGKVMNISKNADDIEIKSNAPVSEIKLKEYLDLNRDYGQIKKKLSNDEILKEAISFGEGIRILKQDHWECLVSFIISANNMIPRIMRSVEKLSKNFGKPIEFSGETFFSFPSAKDINLADVEQIKECGVGFRCNYISNVSKMIVSGEIDLDAIEKMETPRAREELMKIPGVGPKIADCVLLYSYGRYEVFPTDVWIKRIIEVLYLKNEAKLAEIQQFARERFAELAGFAQQYLFFYAREKKIGADK